MPTVSTTSQKARQGVAGHTGRLTTIQVTQPSIEILIGGPYKDRYGELHTYGHAAIRVVTTEHERIYDFGRYGKVTGDFGAEGEGILRVWSSFSSYISGENSYGRTTVGYLYPVSDEQAQRVNSYYEEMLAGAAPRKSKHPNQKEYRLSKNYHGISNNCTTMTLDGARIALPKIDSNSSKFNKGIGMSTSEKLAARAKNFGAWPNRIFMPPDVGLMLATDEIYQAKRVTKYRAQ